jgi:hypothetical protein
MSGLAVLTGTVATRPMLALVGGAVAGLGLATAGLRGRPDDPTATGPSFGARSGSAGSGAAGSRSSRWARGLTRLVSRAGGPGRAGRLLLVDELRIVGRPVEVHTAARTTRALAGIVLAAVAGVAGRRAGLPLPPLALPALAIGGGLVGVLDADRPVRQRAAARRTEARLAVAAYIDLTRTLLSGGLPLHAVLGLSADAGHGWAFAEIRGALEEARQRQLPPDVGLAALADRLPIPAFADLRQTVTSALRGASPTTALASRSQHLRATEAAEARAVTASADAAMELPAAVVSLCFVAFLTYPLLAMLTATSVLP